VSETEEQSERTAPPGAFLTTHWSVVLAAAQDDSSAATEALERLCRAYWYPLYAYVRRRGYNTEDAQDLTQSFFARLIEKDYLKHADRQRGKFRTFLLVSLQRFLSDDWDRTRRIKRGGGEPSIAFDALSAEERYQLEPVDAFDAGRLYDRRWATTLLERALERLAREHRSAGREAQFVELRRFLIGDGTTASSDEVAKRLGLTVAAVRMAVSRLRERYRQALRDEILETVGSAPDAEEEYQALMAALRD